MVGVGFATVKALGAAGQLASGIMSARARRAEFDEALRGLAMKKDYTLGIARVRAGASGTMMNSVSTVDYLSRLTSEFDREAANLRRARNVTGDMDLLGNLSTLLGGSADIYGGLGTLNDWWR